MLRAWDQPRRRGQWRESLPRAVSAHALIRHPHAPRHQPGRPKASRHPVEIDPRPKTRFHEFVRYAPKFEISNRARRKIRPLGTRSNRAIELHQSLKTRRSLRPPRRSLFRRFRRRLIRTYFSEFLTSPCPRGGRRAPKECAGSGAMPAAATTPVVLLSSGELVSLH